LECDPRKKEENLLMREKKEGPVSCFFVPEEKNARHDSIRKKSQYLVTRKKKRKATKELDVRGKGRTNFITRAAHQ